MVGQDFSFNLVDAERLGHSVGGDFVVAGEHDDPDAFLPQCLQRGRRGGLDGVCDREEAYEPAIGSHVDDGGSVAAQLVGTVPEIGGVDVVGVEEVGAAEDQDSPFDGADDAAADW